MRQRRETELGEARQELLEMLAPEGAEDQLGRVGTAPPRHRREDEPGEIGVVEDLDRTIAAARCHVIGHARMIAKPGSGRPCV